MSVAGPDRGTSTATSPHWTATALCATHPDPRLWDETTHEATVAARQICARCPAAVECLADALTGDGAGVRAGYTHYQRRHYQSHGRWPARDWAAIKARQRQLAAGRT